LALESEWSSSSLPPGVPNFFALFASNTCFDPTSKKVIAQITQRAANNANSQALRATRAAGFAAGFIASAIKLVSSTIIQTSLASPAICPRLVVGGDVLVR
jgi:hypothetical protein